MIVEDFVCLGRTVPEESKKYGHRVCMAGYSRELRSLLRVYPLPVVNPIRARHEYRMRLQRNPRDSRIESWRVAGEEFSESHAVATKKDVREFSESIIAGSIQELNNKRASLGVICPKAIQGEFVSRKNCDPLQSQLFDTCDVAFGAKAVCVAPYLNFLDGDGWHRLQLREWGCYEWIRKHPAACGKLWSNLSINENNEHLLVVGNMNNRRNVWLVISVLAFTKSLQPSLF